VTVEEAKSRIPGEVGLGAVTKVEDVHATPNHEKRDRTVELGQASRQPTRFLDVGGAVAVAVHEKDRSSNELGLPER
jgi:hypothetical protein